MHRLNPGGLYISQAGTKVLVLAVEYDCMYRLHKATTLMLDDENVSKIERLSFYNAFIKDEQPFWGENHVA